MNEVKNQTENEKSLILKERNKISSIETRLYSSQIKRYLSDY